MQQTFFVPLLMQMPLAQSLGLRQSEPRLSGSLHSPPMQVYPVAQPVEVPVQLMAHVPPEHAYPGRQATGAGAVHMPEPLQVDMAMLDLASAEQVAGAQVSPAWV